MRRRSHKSEAHYGENQAETEKRNSENWRGLSLQEIDTWHSVETDALDLETAEL